MINHVIFNILLLVSISKQSHVLISDEILKLTCTSTVYNLVHNDFEEGSVKIDDKFKFSNFYICTAENELTNSSCSAIDIDNLCERDPEMLYDEENLCISYENARCKIVKAFREVEDIKLNMITIPAQMRKKRSVNTYDINNLVLRYKDIQTIFVSYDFINNMVKLLITHINIIQSNRVVAKIQYSRQYLKLLNNIYKIILQQTNKNMYIDPNVCDKALFERFSQTGSIARHILKYDWFTKPLNLNDHELRYVEIYLNFGKILISECMTKHKTAQICNMLLHNVDLCPKKGQPSYSYSTISNCLNTEKNNFISYHLQSYILKNKYLLPKDKHECNNVYKELIDQSNSYSLAEESWMYMHNTTAFCNYPTENLRYLCATNYTNVHKILTVLQNMNNLYLDGTYVYPINYFQYLDAFINDINVIDDMYCEPKIMETMTLLLENLMIKLTKSVRNLENKYDPQISNMLDNQINKLISYINNKLIIKKTEFEIIVNAVADQSCLFEQCILNINKLHFKLEEKVKAEAIAYCNKRINVGFCKMIVFK